MPITRTAQLWTTGPALLYAGFGAAASPTWYFIGTAKQKPRIQVRRAMKEVMNDIGGDKATDLD